MDINEIVIDVRPKIEYEFCKLKGTINIPYSYIVNEKNREDLIATFESFRKNTSKSMKWHQFWNSINDNFFSVYLLCRRGNDSQRAVKYLQNLLPSQCELRLFNISGGLHAYSKCVDSSFPIYWKNSFFHKYYATKDYMKCCIFTSLMFIIDFGLTFVNCINIVQFIHFHNIFHSVFYKSMIYIYKRRSLVTFKINNSFLYSSLLWHCSYS